MVLGRSLLPFDQSHQEGLSDRDVHSTDEAGHRREGHQVPDLNGPGQNEDREDHRLRHGRDLGRHHHAVAAPPVAESACKRSHHESGELVGEADEPENQGGAGQLVDEPADGHVLHPGAHQRDSLPGEKEAQVAVA